MCGTPGYIAPEILELDPENSKYNEKCDVFSVGIILYMMTAKQMVFSGESESDLISNNKNCEVDFNLPVFQSNDLLLDLLRKMLQKDPEKRISADEVLQHPFLNEKEQFEEKNSIKNTSNFETKRNEQSSNVQKNNSTIGGEKEEFKSAKFLPWLIPDFQFDINPDLQYGLKDKDKFNNLQNRTSQV